VVELETLVRKGLFLVTVISLLVLIFIVLRGSAERPHERRRLPRWREWLEELKKSSPSLPTTPRTETEACRVKSLEKIGVGAFPKYSPDGERIAYTKEVANSSDPQGFSFEVFVMKEDGSGEKCLTCNKAALSETRWRGQPYWHPSGKYIVFTAETKKYPRKGAGVTARPGIGRNHNVWLMTADGQKFWQLTDYPDNWGVIRPSFSRDGKTLYWNEEFMMEKYPHGKPGVDSHPGCYWGQENKLFRKGEELCAWRVKLADLSFVNGEPQISNIRHIDPPDGFTLIEGTGFTPDDQKLVYSYCNIQQEGGRCFWGDIYTSDLQGKHLKQLTRSPHQHDENPQFSPDGRKIIWNHGQGNPGEGEEVWLMNADGSNKVQLTHFTDSDYPEYSPDARQVPESDWHPSGRSIIFAHVNQKRESGLGTHIPAELFRLTFEGSCGKR